MYTAMRTPVAGARWVRRKTEITNTQYTCMYVPSKTRCSVLILFYYLYRVNYSQRSYMWPSFALNVFNNELCNECMFFFFLMNVTRADDFEGILRKPNIINGIYKLVKRFSTRAIAYYNVTIFVENKPYFIYAAIAITIISDVARIM